MKSFPSVPALLLAVLIPALLPARAGAQQFTEIVPGFSNTAYPCVAWGDYDGDGDLDMLEAGSGRHDVAFTTIYQNNGGNFTDSGVSLLGLARATAAWGDFDGDGDLDLAMTGLTTAGVPTMTIYRNNGGTFTALPGPFPGLFAGNLAWGDYDNDGDLDLLVTGVTSASPSGVAVTRLFRNDAGVFTSVAVPFPNCYLGSVAWGDYNNDGRLDVVITGTSENGPLFAAVWRNDGGGVFTDAGANLPGMDLGFAAWGDYDNDGDLDLLFGGNSNDGFVTRIYRNDGGTFTDINAGLLGLLWSSAAWGDYDNDGDLDLMVFGYDAGPQVTRSILYRNDGGVFVDTGLPFHNLYLGTLSWADYDNDGDLDLLLAGNSSGQDIISLYRNNETIVNTVPTAPVNLSASVVGTTATLSWNSAGDDHTPATGLDYNLRVGTTPGGSQIVSPEAAANGYRRVPALGNAGPNRFATLSGLQPGITYYWSVQALDSAFSGSPFAAEGTFSIAVGACSDAAGGCTITTQDACAAPSSWQGPGTTCDPNPCPITGAPVGRAEGGEGIVSLAPSPFQSTAAVRFRLSEPRSVRLQVFDASGRSMRSVDLGTMGAGDHIFEWNGRGEGETPVPPGIYFLRLSEGDRAWTRTLVRVR